MDISTPDSMDAKTFHLPFDNAGDVHEEAGKYLPKGFPFIPTIKVPSEGDSSLTKTLKEAHNLGAQLLSPAASTFRHFPNLSGFLTLQNNISKDPIAYLTTDKRHTPLQKALALTLSGPAAATADLVIATCRSIAGFVLSLMVGAIGLYNYVVSKGEDTESLKKAGEFITNVAVDILHGVRSLLRMTPIVGVFLGYLASMASGLCQSGYQSLTHEVSKY